MSELTITEFLLARVAGTEKWGRCFPADSSGGRYLLADCEAKRRIIDRHDIAHHCSTGSLQKPVAPPLFAGGDARFPTCDTLKALAQPYADHADFDPKWVL